MKTIFAKTLAFGLAITSAVVADSTGSILYPAANNEAEVYARVIELKHAGTSNGHLLATFENWYTKSEDNSNSNGTAAPYIIRESTDDGSTWSTIAEVYDPLNGTGHPTGYMWQPFLFEFPKKLGNYPEGTILLVGNTVPADGSFTEFFSWRSSDHGKTWDPVNSWQKGGAGGSGIWEPFIYLGANDELIAVFSDERNHTEHSQMLVHVISTDGGDTWSDPVQDVASPVQVNRPGMATVAKMDNGKYVMAYEFCGEPNCLVHYKISDDGVNWDASDDGVKIETFDGLTGGASPYVVWVEEIKSLVLACHFVMASTDDEHSAQWYRAVFLNLNHGKGPWDWAPSPWAVSDASSACNANYSPDLLPSGHGGLVRYTAPTSTGASGYCEENTGIAVIGYLPYSSNFSDNGQSGWNNYGGNWSVKEDTYRVTTDSNTDLALTGSTAWKDYSSSVQVKLGSPDSNAGISARVTSPTIGDNTFKGYTAYINSGTGKISLVRQDYSSGYMEMTSASVSGGLSESQFYQLELIVSGYNISATVSPVGSSDGTTISYQDTTYSKGLFGLYASNGDATFQSVSVVAVSS